jgi:hypothetical protein
MALDLRLERGKPLLNRSLNPRQLAAGLERIPASIRPHLGAVDGDLGERHNSLGDQRHHAFGQQPVENLHVRHPEVRKPMIIQWHPTGDPSIR